MSTSIVHSKLISHRLHSINKKLSRIESHLKNQTLIQPSSKQSNIIPNNEDNLLIIDNIVHNNNNDNINNIDNNNDIKPKLIVPGRRSLLGFGAFACSICAAIANSNNKQSYTGMWNYENEGPSTWNRNGVCIPNSFQSPINIIKDDSIQINHKPISFNYGDGNRGRTTVVNTGHGTMQVNFEEGLYTSTVDDKVLNLLQFHFHTPSEHAFDGIHSAMEVHLVHKDIENGELNVIGTMMDGSGQPNAALQGCIEEAPLETGYEHSITIDPNTLLPHPNKRSYFNYRGSLTTPPCSEDVNWYLFENSIQCSPRQVLNFQKYLQHGNSLSMNSRPLQPLNNRHINYSSK